jgi:hypothetical protein
VWELSATTFCCSESVGTFGCIAIERAELALPSHFASEARPEYPNADASQSSLITHSRFSPEPYKATTSIETHIAQGDVADVAGTRTHSSRAELPIWDPGSGSEIEMNVLPWTRSAPSHSAHLVDPTSFHSDEDRETDDDDLDADHFLGVGDDPERRPLVSPGSSGEEYGLSRGPTAQGTDEPGVEGLPGAPLLVATPLGGGSEGRTLLDGPEKKKRRRATPYWYCFLPRK